MWKWVLVGALVLVFVPSFVFLTLTGNFFPNYSIGFLVPKAPAALGQGYVEAVRHRDFAPVQKALNRKYVTAQLPSVLGNLSAQFPAGEPSAIRVTHVHWTLLAKGQRIYTLVYEYDYPHDNVMAKVVISQGDGLTILEGLHVWRLDEQMRRANRLSFSGKTPVHFLFLTALLAVYAFTLVTAFYCMKTPIPRFKWAWVIFVLIGFVTFRFNWASGAFGVQPISLLLCSIGIQKAPLDPVILELAVPIGAILFWWRRSVWLEAAGPDLRRETPIP